MRELYEAFHGKEYTLFNKFSVPGAAKMSLFPFGIKPLLLATGLSIFLAGLSPKLNKLSAKYLKRKVMSPALLLSFLFAGAQSYFIAIFLSRFDYDGDVIITIKPTLFVITALVWYLGGYVILLTILRLMRIHGITSGLALFILFPSVSMLFFQIAPLFHSHLPVDDVLKFTLFLFLLGSAVFWLVGYKKTIELENDHNSTKFKLQIPLNLLGVLPLFTLTLPFLSSFYIVLLSDRFPALSTMADSVSSFLSTNQTFVTVMTLIISGKILFLFNYPQKRIIAQLKRFGYTNSKEHEKIFETLKMALLINMAFLICGLYLLKKLSTLIDNQVFDASFIINLFLAVLLIKRVFKDIKSPIIRKDEREVVLDEYDTGLEAALTLEHLTGSGIKARIINSRFIEFTGTTAFWSLCHPRFITGSIYPFLDNGGITIVVPNEQADEANKCLSELNNSDSKAPEAHQE